MKNSSMVFLTIITFLLGACGSASTASSGPRAATPSPMPASAPSSAFVPAPQRVLVEATLFEVPTENGKKEDTIAPKDPSSLDRTEAVSSSFLMVNDGQKAGLSAGDYKLEARPEVRENGHIHLDLELTYGLSNSTPFRTSVDVAPNEWVTMPTTLNASPNHSALLRVRPRIIRNQDDLRAVFEEKVRERDRIKAEKQATGKDVGAPSFNPCPPETLLAIRRISATEFEVPKIVMDGQCTLDSFQPLVSRAIPEAVQGKLVGIRLMGIQPKSLMSSLGLENGDRIDSINGKSLASPNAALEAISSARTAKQFEVVLERNGKPLKFRYTVK